jgi:hypothetical protein
MQVCHPFPSEMILIAYQLHSHKYHHRPTPRVSAHTADLEATPERTNTAVTGLRPVTRDFRINGCHRPATECWTISHA